MEAWLLSLFAALALPKFGLSTVFVVWKAEPYVRMAGDSYVVRKGKIVLQTWAWRVEDM